MNWKNRKEVILVNTKDKKIGAKEKLQAHINGDLHRAFSIFVFNPKKELLMQKRADSKYHSAGLWSNTTCSHPKPGESLIKACHRRLKEEMGFDCPLKRAFEFHYNFVFDNGLMENEIDHVFIGEYKGKVKLNKNEVSDYKWISLKDLKKEIKENPRKYSIWLKIILEKFEFKLSNRNKFVSS